MDPEAHDAASLHGRCQGLLLETLLGPFVHDMNNVLGLASGYASLLPDCQAPEETRSTVTEIEIAVQRAGSMLAALGRLVRTASCGDEMLAVPDLLEDVRLLTEKLLARNHTLLELSWQPSAAAVRSRVPLLLEVLLHLVVNAGEGPLGEGGASRVWVEACRTPRGAEFLVRDDGPGLPESLAVRLFQPFVTAKPGRRGLGLWAARSAATLLGASLAYEHPRDQGHLFRLSLPEDSEP